MNSHKNARTTYEGRKLLIERIAVIGLIPAAEAAGISVRTARKWKKRFETLGLEGLADLSSRPHRTRTSLDVELVERIERLRRARMPMRTIGRVVGRSVATISRALKALGLSSLKALDPAPLVVRYERAAPGELLNIDTKKLGRIVRPSHRVTGDRRDSVDGAGWEFAHVAIDDHSRAGFVQMHADEKKASAVQFLQDSVAHYAALGVRIERLADLGEEPGAVSRAVVGQHALDANAERGVVRHRVLKELHGRGLLLVGVHLHEAGSGVIV